jgi:DNA invertase Pin-like site-specific DNA recombinase
MTTAYSYVRFSSAGQANGDSYRRQVEATKAWCDRNNAHLADVHYDPDRNAFRGGHRVDPDRNALAQFLRMVHGDGIPRGSYLVVESLDRLTREHIRPALTLLLNLIEAGIRIVQLKPVEVVYGEDVEPMQLMMALMELSRGNSESRMKSERIGAAWRRKRTEAKPLTPITKQLPNWLRVEDGKIVLDADKAATVRRVFGMARDGHGIASIAKALNDDGTPPVSKYRKPTRWRQHHVTWLLTNRAVLGEYQPHTCKDGERVPDGPVHGDYYPRAVEAELWEAARAAIGVRTCRKPGRPARGKLNVFAGLLRDARDGGPFHVVRKRDTQHIYSAMVGKPRASFPLAAFEEGLLDRLAELPDLRPDTSDGVDALMGRLAEAETAVAKLAEMLYRNPSDAVAATLQRREQDAKRLKAELEQARHDAVRGETVAVGWRETDRHQLRAAVMRTVTSLHCLMLPERAPSTVVVQAFLVGGAVRWYRIRKDSAESWVLPDLGQLDMRNADHTRIVTALNA